MVQLLFIRNNNTSKAQCRVALCLKNIIESNNTYNIYLDIKDTLGIEKIEKLRGFFTMIAMITIMSR